MYNPPTAQGPTDWSVRVLDVRRQTAAEVTRLGRLLARPPLPLAQRAKRPASRPRSLTLSLLPSWTTRYGFAAHPGAAPVATLKFWRELYLDDVAQYGKAYITYGIRVWTKRSSTAIRQAHPRMHHKIPHSCCWRGFVHGGGHWLVSHARRHGVVFAHPSCASHLESGY